MMFSYRLVRLIGIHAETLAAGLEKKVLSLVFASRRMPQQRCIHRAANLYLGGETKS
jgi:hypothetical protein